MSLPSKDEALGLIASFQRAMDYEGSDTIAALARLGARVAYPSEETVERVAKAMDLAEWSDDAEAAVVASEHDRYAYNRFLARAALTSLKDDDNGK